MVTKIIVTHPYIGTLFSNTEIGDDDFIVALKQEIGLIA